jgi:hypothetical protein
MDQVRGLHELKRADLISGLDAGPEDQPGQGTTARMCGVRGQPWSYLIDRSGKVAFASNDPANQGAMMGVARKLGIDVAAKLTDEQMTRLLETFLGEMIEKVLARP